MVKMVENIEDEAYIGIKLSEYKELLVIKGKYEELSKKEEIIKWNPPIIQPLTTPYPEDLTPRFPSYPIVTCKLAISKD